LHGGDDKLIATTASTTLHANIHDFTLTIHPGMGHELPRPLWGQIVDQICDNADRAAHR
jgi:hypothetical protein